MPYFQTARDIELSIIYYLKTQIDASWSSITTTKSFADVYSKNVALPVVCIRLADTIRMRKEVGSTTLDNHYLIIIDIFATSDGQRIDLSDFIATQLASNWTHYEHSHPSGSNSTLSRVANGKDKVEEFITDTALDISDSPDPKDRYRHTISVRVKTSI